MPKINNDVSEAYDSGIISPNCPVVPRGCYSSLMFNHKYRPPKNINLSLLKEKLSEAKVAKEKAVITVTPNDKCSLCHGKGRMTVVTNKLPGMKNAVLGGGKIRLKEFCADCVMPKAYKEANRLKLSEGEEFDIKLSTEIKEEVKEEPKKNEQAI